MTPDYGQVIAEKFVKIVDDGNWKPDREAGIAQLASLINTELAPVLKDKERLDWLENNKEAWTEIESPEGWPDKLWHIGSAEDHHPLGRKLADNWSSLGRKTLREAIDAAMPVEDLRKETQQ